MEVWRLIAVFLDPSMLPTVAEVMKNTGANQDEVAWISNQLRHRTLKHYCGLAVWKRIRLRFQEDFEKLDLPWLLENYIIGFPFQREPLP